MVSIAAFQAVDPGSIPGHRIYFLITRNGSFLLAQKDNIIDTFISLKF